MSLPYNNIRRFGNLVTNLAPVSLLLSCGTPSAPSQPASPAGKTVFGKEDRRIAATLSIGRPALLQEEASEYGRAILCKVALDSIAPRLSELTSAEQRALLGHVEAQLAERAFVQGSAAGKSRTEVERDLEAKATEVDDPSVLVPTAMACLRAMA